MQGTHLPLLSHSISAYQSAHLTFDTKLRGKLMYYGRACSGADIVRTHAVSPTETRLHIFAGIKNTQDARGVCVLAAAALRALKAPLYGTN